MHDFGFQTIGICLLAVALAILFYFEHKHEKEYTKDRDKRLADIEAKVKADIEAGTFDPGFCNSSYSPTKRRGRNLKSNSMFDSTTLTASAVLLD